MRCMVLGATGVVGQRFVSLLAAHPEFELAAVAGSDRTSGRPYAAAWRPPEPLPESAADLPVLGLDELPGPDAAPIVFSALPGGVAGPVERGLAQAGHRVFTNAADLRMEPYVPLLIPEVNAPHIALVDRQPGRARSRASNDGRPEGQAGGDAGYVVANGNCTGIVLTLALAPLAPLGIASVDVTSMQALSGAGHPGVSALDIAGNVLVHIPGEEAKLETEPHKHLGDLADGGVAPAGFPVRATCTRVAVAEGHLESIHVRFHDRVDDEAARRAYLGFRGPPAVQALPSAPRRPIHVLDGDRPQPRLDAMAEGGMAVAVGRLRPDADGRGIRLLALGSNTVRGAAGQSILNAEWALAWEAKA